MTRSFLRIVCRTLAGIVFVAQLAVAAYACPGTPSAATDSQTPDVAIVLSSAHHCADMMGPMDPAFGNLCLEHCHHGQQSDQVASLTVPGILLTELYVTPSVPAQAMASRPAADTTSALAAASPPITILHCCFRI